VLSVVGDGGVVPLLHAVMVSAASNAQSAIRR